MVIYLVDTRHLVSFGYKVGRYVFIRSLMASDEVEYERLHWYTVGVGKLCSTAYAKIITAMGSRTFNGTAGTGGPKDLPPIRRAVQAMKKA